MPNHPNRSKRTPSESRTPKPEEVRAWRRARNLSAAAAAALVHTSPRAWLQWESEPDDVANHRRMHPAFWELVRLKMGE
jgi:DNA-binding transcriptional regulator YiaG